MDYTNFKDFPFPSKLSYEEQRLKKHFFTLTDEEQLEMLNGCKSYKEFCERLSRAAV